MEKLNVNSLKQQLLARVSSQQQQPQQQHNDNDTSPPPPPPPPPPPLSLVVKQTQFTRKIVPEPTLGIREMEKRVNITLSKRVHIFNLKHHVVENILGHNANDHINPMFKFYSLPYGWSEELLKQVAKKFEQIMHV